MYEGYLTLDGVELVNNARYDALAAALGLPRPARVCKTLREVLADDPYTTGNAPWADTGAPEAAGFAGFHVTSITGLSAATATRSVTDTVGDVPAVPGPARTGPRTMLVTAFAAATSPAALTYGLQWLRAVLHDDCRDRCAGATVCMLDECPACDVSTGPDADDCWEAHARTCTTLLSVSTGPR